jgi:iron complex outermembrane receptor protein
LITTANGAVRVDGLCRGEMAIVVYKAGHGSIQLRLDVNAPLTRSIVELDPLDEHHSVEVVVTSNAVEPTVATTQSLSGADLARKRGQGLAETIGAMPGVATLRSAAGGMGKPMVRGHVGRRMLILVDGIPHEAQAWGLDHAPEVDTYSADRITVIKGAATTRYGPQAIGGAVLLEARPLLRQPGVHSEASLVSMSNPLGGGGAARVDVSGSRWRGLALRLEGNVSRNRAAQTPDYPLDNTGSWIWNAGMRGGYASERMDVEVGYRLLRSRLGICTCVRLSTPEEFQQGVELGKPVGSEFYRADFEIERPYQELWHHLAHARARRAVGRFGEAHASYSFQYNDRREFDIVRESISGPQLNFGLATHNADVHLEHAPIRLEKSAFLGMFGATIRHQVNSFDAATTLIPDYRQFGGGLYAIERWVRERSEFEIGARYEGQFRQTSLNQRDFLSQQAGGRLDPAACRASGDGALCEHDFHGLSATLGALVRPMKELQNLSVRVQLDSSARIPSIDESFMNGAAPSFPILGIGNSNLNVERTWGTQSTIEYNGEAISVELAGYANYVNNYIYFVPERQEGQCAPLTCTTRGPMPLFAFKAVDASFVGGEVSADWHPKRLPVGLVANATWVRARDLVAGDHLALLPADRYFIAGRYRLADRGPVGGAYLELNTTYVARQSRYQIELDFAAPPPAYVLLGAGAGFEIAARQTMIRMSLVGTNLLNARYRDYTSLLRYYADEPGWGAQFRLSVDFDGFQMLD